ncbi:glycosyltransferase [Salegentibacter sp. F188]|uniref:Glycosyltransferase n=1 Tax=Autumnicola patrickiae TaxID=3075591 RepID=A0ABU3E1E8_9FLAO|nr:glycosyltransferase [Salegentibacter sp. F188]MDT0689831.1 glycosyltransferase [Salegentibacter sp. F188]
MVNQDFAAFVITYERTEILLRTIKIIRNQSSPPAYLLIVDNSTTNLTEEALKPLISPELDYLRIGYNSGPAGGAKIGLQHITELGFKWVYWGDDNDPPRDLEVFREMLKSIKEIENSGVKLGIFGGKGGTFNKYSGRVKALTNEKLKKERYAEADFVPGGHTLIVNTEVVRKGILPNEKLFFGFEDLDFSIKVKQLGFAILVHSESWLRVRYKYDNSANNYRWRDSSFGKNSELLVREFYSTRSLLDIFYKNNFYFAFGFLLFKSIGKMILGFRHGLDYGKRMLGVQSAAISSFLRSDFKKQQDPF